MSDIDTVVVDSLKALDPERPIMVTSVRGRRGRPNLHLVSSSRRPRLASNFNNSRYKGNGTRFHLITPVFLEGGCEPERNPFIFLTSGLMKELRMSWTAPTLVEICIGLEINGYLPAEF